MTDHQCKTCHRYLYTEREAQHHHRIRELEQFCRAIIRYAGHNGDDFLADMARGALGGRR